MDNKHAPEAEFQMHAICPLAGGNQMVAYPSAISSDVQMRLRIIDAVDKPLDIMSVSEICKNSGISRQTFYNHFESKYSLVSWWSEWCEGFYLNKIGFEYSWEEGYLRHTSMLLSKSGFLIRALKSKDYAPYLGSEQITNRRKGVLLDTLKSKGVEVDDLLMHCVDCFSFLEAESIYKIFRKGLSAPLGVVDLTRKSLAIIPPPLYDAIQPERFKNKSQLENLKEIGSIVARIYNEGVGMPFL